MIKDFFLNVPIFIYANAYLTPNPIEAGALYLHF
jgi:hypothetical protein